MGPLGTQFCVHHHDTIVRGDTSMLYILFREGCYHCVRGHISISACHEKVQAEATE